METLNQILARIQKDSLDAGREKQPLLIAVSKFQTIEKIIGLYEQGQRAFGENYVQELVTKKKLLQDLGYCGLEFHFIGKLQKNKVKTVLPHVRAIHSVDSIRLLEEIEKKSQELSMKPEVYFQINIDEEPTKGGFLASDLENLCGLVRGCRNLIPSGLMAIPDPQRDPENAFERMKKLSLEYGEILGTGLSMGMSGDFGSAIRNGSTVIRIGTALFGERE